MAPTKTTKGPASTARSGVVHKKKEKAPLHRFIEKTPKKFGIGQALPPKSDKSRFVRWPLCVQIQRKRAILLKRLKVPPALNQFRYPCNKNEATQLFRLLNKYRPETSKEKKARLLAEAERRAKGEQPSQSKKPYVMKSGVDHVTRLIEKKEALLVVIAHDIDPIEIGIHLPSLCRKMEVPYCIVKNKARLGTLIHMKNCGAVALDAVRKEDQAALDQLVKNLAPEFLENKEVMRRWGNH